MSITTPRISLKFCKTKISAVRASLSLSRIDQFSSLVVPVFEANSINMSAVRITIMGVGGVGKSALTQRVVNKKFVAKVRGLRCY